MNILKRIPMKLLYLVTGFCFSILISGCVTQPDSYEAARKSLYKQVLQTDEIKNCKKNGGRVEDAGMDQLPHCVIDYPDAGKPCKDSSECKDGCLLFDTSIPMGTPVTGMCRKNNIKDGCYSYVDDGIAGPAICVN